MQAAENYTIGEYQTATLIEEQTVQPQISEQIQVSKKAIGLCAIVEANNDLLNPNHESTRQMSPIDSAGIYFEKYVGRVVSIPIKPDNIKLLLAPKHGKLRPIDVSDSESQSLTGVYEYVPAKDFKGGDRVVFQVGIEGQQVLVNYYIHVIDYPETGTNPYSRECKDASTNPWKISSTFIHIGSDEKLSESTLEKLFADISTPRHI